MTGKIDSDLDRIFGHLNLNDLLTVVSATPTKTTDPEKIEKNIEYKSCTNCGATIDVHDSCFTECPNCQIMNNSMVETDTMAPGSRIPIHYKNMGSERKDNSKQLIDKIKKIFADNRCQLHVDETVFMLAARSAANSLGEIQKHVTHRGDNLSGILVYLVRLYLENEKVYIGPDTICTIAKIDRHVYDKAETLIKTYKNKYNLILPNGADRTKLHLIDIMHKLGLHPIYADFAHALLHIINTSPIPSSAKENTRIAGIIYYITTHIPQCPVTKQMIEEQTNCKVNTIQTYYNNNLAGREVTVPPFRNVVLYYAQMRIIVVKAFCQA